MYEASALATTPVVPDGLSQAPHHTGRARLPEVPSAARWGPVNRKSFSDT